jgi:glycerophosphoryl diester phosphodiesterase
MKIISHRGFYRDTDIKENTRAAFERAIRHGVSGIETDIRLSADGQPILYHDRLAPDQRPVEMVSRRQLEDITRHEIPSLGEVLATWPDVLWDLEVKCRAALPITIDLIRKHARPDRVMIASFCHDVIAECARQLDVAGGLLIAHAPLDVTTLLEPWQAMPRVRTVVWDFNVIEATIVSQAIRAGFQVWAYGVINADEFDLCRSLGLDAVITDNPPEQ